MRCKSRYGNYEMYSRDLTVEKVRKGLLEEVSL